MVCIGNRVHDNIPCLIPIEMIVVDKNSHKLGDTHCGVSVVDMNSHFICKIIQCAVNREVIADYALAGSRNKEILLCKAQKLTFCVIV